MSPGPVLPTCPVCAKHRGVGDLVGPVLLEDDLVVVSLRADGPPGYGFVETRRHVGGLEALTDAEASALGRVTSALARALAAELAVERVHTFVAGLGVDHLHQHVYVRPAGTSTDVPWWPPVEAADGPNPETLASSLRLRLASEAERDEAPRTSSEVLGAGRRDGPATAVSG